MVFGVFGAGLGVGVCGFCFGGGCVDVDCLLRCLVVMVLMCFPLVVFVYLDGDIRLS